MDREIAFLNRKLAVVIKYLHNHLDDDESTRMFDEIERIIDETFRGDE